MTTPEPTTLREALTEAIHWVTTYDDTMGHGYYCATQSGEFGESCTCGYDEMMDRWRTTLATPPAALDVEPTRQEVDRMRRALAASVYSHDPDGAAVMAYEVAAAYQQPTGGEE